MDITSTDNSWEKCCSEAEDGAGSLFTWRVWDRRRYFCKWEKLEQVKKTHENGLFEGGGWIYKKRKKEQ